MSGGRDSVALLHGLKRLGFRRLVVLHLDHRLRGRKSTDDARFVRALGAQLALRVICGRGNVAEYAAQRGLSLETAARELRHVFFANCAAVERCRFLFLAHHANDQVETCLFHFLRGSGPAGIRGMRRVSEMSVAGRMMIVIRPMLEISREFIDGFLARNLLRFREDESNRSVAHTRNRIRHELIPIISDIMGPSASLAIRRAGKILSAEDDLLEELTPHLDVEPQVRALREMPRALRRRAVRRWLMRGGVPEPGFDLTERVLDLIEEGARVAKINLPLGWHVRRCGGRLFIERP